MKFSKLLCIALSLLLILSVLTGCGLVTVGDPIITDENGDIIETDKNGETVKSKKTTSTDKKKENADEIKIPDEEIVGVGEDLSNTGINDGKFSGTTSSSDFTVSYVSGTQNAYTYDDTTKVLKFTSLSSDSIYAISGKLNGNIIIDAGDSYKLELELSGFSLRSSNTNPIFINSGNEIKITAKKDTKNYIYDERAAVDTSQSGVYGGSIHSAVDLDIRGKGELFVQSENNNGIQSTKDLQVKNLSLIIECQDNALKGKDSVTIENCSTLLVAKSGDAIKTESTDISSNTGKQRGTVSILGGTHNIFAGNDGIDAAYDVIIDYGTYTDDSNKEVTVDTILNIYTDKYSNYTNHSQNSSSNESSGNNTLYICYPSNDYKYSVKLLNNDSSKSEWVNPTYDKAVQSNRTTYHTYKFNTTADYTKMQLFIYTSSQSQQNESSYYYKSDVISIHNTYNTYRYSSSKKSWSWADYNSLAQGGGGGMGGPGGMNEGNPNALAYSAKAIKGANTININAGTITIKASDDAIHADNTTTLENGQSPKGNLTINGGDITINTQDDGLHADGALTIVGGNVNVLSSYEGVEGNTITVSGGSVSIISNDDGFNAGATSGTGITISGGSIYIYAGGDGVDSNSRASYSAISFEGGNTVIISTSGGNSAIDSDGGYKYTGGKVLAIMPQGGMSGESKHCSNFSSIGKAQNVNLSANAYATVSVGGTATVSVKMPKSINAIAIYLGSSSATITSATSSAGDENNNGVFWK